MLARILADLALATGEAEDREEAITALERARSLSWDAEVDAACLASLARLRLQRFSDLHEPADLESAINEGFEVAIGEDASASVRQLAVVTVAQGLRIRAEATGSKDDLTVAIYQAETLLAEMGTSYAPFQLEVRDLVAVLLRRRFSYTADLADLDRAISMRRQLLEESADDRERALHLDNLGNLYNDRYGALHERGDLEAALDASRDALRLLEEDAPERGLMLANLGLSLTTLFRESRERRDSDEAVRRFREGLALPNLQPDVGLRLHAGLGRHLLARSALLTEATALDDAIDELRSTLVLALAEEGRLPVTFRLGQRSRLLFVSHQLTGALLRRSRGATASASATEDLLEAVAVSEATKSPLLVQALLHRTQVSEPTSADGFLEGQQLSLLDALDSAELAVGETGISSDEQVGWMERRYRILDWLEELWTRYEDQSPELAARVARLRYPAALVLAAFVAATRPRSCSPSATWRTWMPQAPSSGPSALCSVPRGMRRLNSSQSSPAMCCPGRLPVWRARWLTMRERIARHSPGTRRSRSGSLADGPGLPGRRSVARAVGHEHPVGACPGTLRLAYRRRQPARRLHRPFAGGAGPARAEPHLVHPP